jgi:hypothetical protein
MHSHEHCHVRDNRGMRATFDPEVGSPSCGDVLKPESRGIDIPAPLARIQRAGSGDLPRLLPLSRLTLSVAHLPMARSCRAGPSGLIAIIE